MVNTELDSPERTATLQFFYLFSPHQRLARKLALSPPLLNKYSKILADQEHRGFIERVQLIANPTRCHYILHHPVHKESSTTPIRIVYDCSRQQGTA